jgi:DNA-binding transcriptional MerR regulator
VTHADANGPLLGIGAFARRSRLSLKALRLYEQQGLLAPVAVNQRTGYRRYHENQLLRARAIVMMRRVGIPLEQVAEILAAPGATGADILAGFWTEAERRFEAQRDLVTRLRTSLLSGGYGCTDTFEIRERDVPDRLLLTETRHLRVTELRPWLIDALHRLPETASADGGLAGSPFVIYHGAVDEDGDGPVEVCVPVRPGTDRPATRHEPAHREAYVTVTKAQLEFPRILSAFDAVSGWICSAGLASCGPPREVYRDDTDVPAAAPDDVVCDVAYPIIRNS